MEKHIRTLAIVLAIQVILALVMVFFGPALSTQAPDIGLVAFKGSDIDGVSIVGGAGESITLAKKDGHWILPERKGFPANGSQVDHLLEGLSHLKHGLPVATTASAQTRFKVAEKEFERKIVLSQNGTPKVVLYLGTSPGLRQVHARLEGSEATLSVAFATHQAPVKVDEWIDKSILAIPLEEIATMTFAGLTVTPQEPAAPAEKKDIKPEATNAPPPPEEKVSWTLQPLASGETANTEELAKLARAIAHLSADGLEEAVGENATAMDKPLLELTVKRKNGTETVFKFAKVEKTNLSLVKFSGRDEIFRIANYVGDMFLKNARKESLIIAPKKEEVKKEDTQGAAPLPDQNPAATTSTPIPATGVPSPP
ncbi:MAG: DUF4340 domain-containing protein [Magnetococcus sp. THC-1_WYH]